LIQLKIKTTVWE